MFVTSFEMSSANNVFIWAVVVTIIIIILTPVSATQMPGTFLKGNKIPCNEEGKLVDIPFLRNDPCITCMCINSEIDCFRDTCPETLNCYHYHHPNASNAFHDPASCCRKCLSCSIGNDDDKVLNNGEIYQDSHDVCKTYHCNSGALTIYQTECHVPCRKPIFFPGQCCPSCNACPVNIRDGEEIPASNDKCIRCYCFKGQMICTKKHCPVLPCPRSEWNHSPHSCCPTCQGSVVVDLDHSKRGSCLINGKVYRHLQNFTIDDECIKCQCRNSTSVCQRQSCPSLTCTEPVKDSGQCCQRCSSHAADEEASRIKKESKSVDCIYHNRHLKNGEYTDQCKQCQCIQGRIECDNGICPRDFVCPQGHRKARINGECCESCVPEDGKCSLQWLPNFGINISTYDGRRYQFEGQCNHVLTRDCEAKRFSVHLVNKFRNSSTKANPIYRGTSLMVRIDGSRIMLSHLGRVRVNRSLVHLPYIQMGQFSIVQTQDRIKLHAVIGLNILWHRNKSIEVKIKSHFRDQACGLCGNFNLDAEDEFQTKNTKQITSPERFVQSFKVGQNILCPKTKTKAMLMESSPSLTKCPDAVRVCNRLRQRHQPCGLNADQVYRQCLEDMCHCRPGDRRCQCYIIKRFIQGCKQNPDRQADFSSALCDSLQCPPGSEFRFCSYECRKTCQNQDQNCRRKICRSGCECIGNRVWFRGQCIPEIMCPM